MNELLTKLSIASGLSKEYIKEVIDKADESYSKRYVKINGKERLFYIPSEEVKLVQNLVIDLFLFNMTVSENAHAYVKRKSIKTNALSHRKSSFFFQTDIVSFFPSIKSTMIRDHILEFRNKNPEIMNLSDEAVNILVKIIAPFGRLDLGSSTSPIVSNIIMYKFDNILNERLTSLLSKPIYTRYSDDITISSDEHFDAYKVLNLIKELLSKDGFEINAKKTRYMQNKDNIKITGVFLGTDEKLSVGTNFKKKLKHSLYDITRSKPTEEDSMKIRGMLSYLKDIEPGYYAKLILKYSDSERSIFDFLKDVSL